MMIEGEGKIDAAFISRFGGIGDIICLTPIAKYIHDKTSLIVHYSINENLYGLVNGLPFIKPLPTRRYFDVDMVRHGKIWYANDVVRRLYKLWIEFKFSIEANSMYRQWASPKDYWLNSQNSNYQNWYDIWFSWINVDPEEVPPEYKRPILALTDEERAFAENALRGLNKVVLVQGISSALPRTIYRQRELVEKLQKLGNVLVWDGQKWVGVDSGVVITLPGDEDWKRVRLSAALVERASVVVCADSGISHIAEALNVPHVTTYTTVPPWTRNKYYKFERAVRSAAKCSPCFSLERGCPLIMANIDKYLSERELKLKQMLDARLPLPEIARRMETHEGGLHGEIQALQQRMNALINIEPECTKKLDLDEIVELAKQSMRE